MINPFQQYEKLWQLELLLPFESIRVVEELLEDLALAQSYFETGRGSAEWRWRMVFPGESLNEVKQRLSNPLLIPLIKADAITPLPKQDWVAQVQKSFKPLHAGRYYIYGSHIKEPLPWGKIPILMDAGAAFGTGEHETTSGCLLALDYIARFITPKSILDVGTGTGILAIAAAKTWRDAEVTATDIDPVSVAVARQNIINNQVTNAINCFYSNGYKSARIIRGQDVIIANILAKPLINMAKDLKLHLSRGGYAILSGLLVRQIPAVMVAHRRQGLVLKTIIKNDNWAVLICQKR